MTDNLVRRKGKSELPKLWNDIPKSTQNLDKINCKCVISIDEHTAIAKWESETKEEFNDLLGGNIEPISIGYKPDLNNDS